jgi:hypothetical protein
LLDIVLLFIRKGKCKRHLSCFWVKGCADGFDCGGWPVDDVFSCCSVVVGIVVVLIVVCGNGNNVILLGRSLGRSLLMKEGMGGVIFAAKKNDNDNFQPPFFSQSPSNSFPSPCPHYSQITISFIVIVNSLTHHPFQDAKNNKSRNNKQPPPWIFRPLRSY